MERLNELERNLKMKDKRIERLEKDVSELKTQIELLKKYIKLEPIKEVEIPDKIKQINTDKIKPLTLELVENSLVTYTSSHYLDGISGLERFMRCLIKRTEGGIFYKSYVCESEKEFYRLVEGNKWKKEDSSFLTEMLEILKPKIMELLHQHKRNFPEFKPSEKFITFTKGITERAGNNREALLKELVYKLKNAEIEKQKSKPSYYREESDEEGKEGEEEVLNESGESKTSEEIVEYESDGEDDGGDGEDDNDGENNGGDCNRGVVKGEYDRKTPNEVLSEDDIIKNINGKKPIPSWARP